MGPGRKRQHGCATLGTEHTVLLRPLFGGEPELLGGEIGNVSENGDGLRARGERRRWLRCGEATIEGVGDGHGGGEKRGGDHVVERHRRREGGKMQTKKEDGDGRDPLGWTLSLSRLSINT